MVNQYLIYCQKIRMDIRILKTIRLFKYLLHTLHILYRDILHVSTYVVKSYAGTFIEHFDYVANQLNDY